jgi:Flp pilus assembly pilin Flp
LKTLYGRFVSEQWVAIGVKYVVVAAIISVAIFSTLASTGSSLFNTTYELALNAQAER